jgi:hypothetical protein
MQELNEVEMFRAVLDEMLMELKQLHSATKEMKETIDALNEKIDGFNVRLENLQVVAPPPDLEPVKGQLAEGVSEFNRQVKESMDGIREVYTQHLKKLTDTLEAQPKPIVRRISLFPENDTRGHFKYFMKCLVLGILGMTLLAGLFSLGQQYLARHSNDQSAEYNVSPSQAAMPSAPGPHAIKVQRKKHGRSNDGGVAMGRVDSVGSLPDGADSGR